MVIRFKPELSSFRIEKAIMKHVYKFKLSLKYLSMDWKQLFVIFLSYLAINDLFGRNSAQDPIDYSVRAGRKDHTNILSVSLFYDHIEFKSISVSYLVTSRNDLFLGSFIIDSFSTSGCSKSNEATNSIAEYVPGLINSNQYKITIFISGIKTIRGEFSVSIWEPRVD